MFNIMPQMKPTPDLMNLAMRQLMARNQYRAIHPYQQALEQQKYEAEKRATKEAPLAHDITMQKLADMTAMHKQREAEQERLTAQEQRTAVFEPQRIALAKAQIINTRAQAFNRMHPEKKDELGRMWQTIKNLEQGPQTPETIAKSKMYRLAINNKLHPRSAVNIGLGSVAGVPGSVASIGQEGQPSLAITPQGTQRVPGTGKSSRSGITNIQDGRIYITPTAQQQSAIQRSLSASSDYEAEMNKLMKQILPMQGVTKTKKKIIGKIGEFIEHPLLSEDKQKQYREHVSALKRLPNFIEQSVKAQNLNFSDQTIKQIASTMNIKPTDSAEQVKTNFKNLIGRVKRRRRKLLMQSLGFGTEGGYRPSKTMRVKLPPRNLIEQFDPKYREIPNPAWSHYQKFIKEEKENSNLQKQTKYSDADIEATAKKYGSSIDQIKKVLGI